MVYSIAVTLENLAEQGFAPRPFGGSSQVVLNTTSFSSILSQLHNVDQSFNAQESDDEPGPLSLLETGCYLNSTSEAAMDGGGQRAGDGFRDCAAACADPSTMFNSSFTLWNCLTLAAASVYVADLDMIIDADSLMHAGGSMGFDNLDQFNSTQIFDDTLKCITGSCQDYSLGSCSTTITTLNISTAENEVIALWSGLLSYCDGLESVVNSDIAGPGVVLSYIMQAALAIAVYFFINLFTGWVQPILSFLYTVQDRTTGTARPGRTKDTSTVGLKQRRTPWQRAGEHQRALQRSRPAAALTSALVEFQEVQTFFVISIQFATLFVFARADHAAMLSSTSSFAEAVTNVQIVQLLSINGMLPVLFTQIGLMRLGIRWWYMTTLVLAVFVTAIVISQQSLMPDYTTLWTYFKSESAIDMCGGNPSPMTYCLDSLDGLNAKLNKMNDSLVVGCLVITALVFDQVWYSLNNGGGMDERLDKWELANSKVLFLRRRVMPMLLCLMWFGLELALLIYVGIYLKSVVDLLKFVGTSASDWTFGQLIAIMVWAPVVGKYLYYNAFGITEGVGKRLHSRYKIVELEEDHGNEDDDDDSDSKPRHSSRETEEGGIEMGPPRLSRENTLVAMMTPGTPYADSPYKEGAGYGKKSNPFADRFGEF
ncbi:unnamed protein product [Discula destructiva]